MLNSMILLTSCKKTQLVERNCPVKCFLQHNFSTSDNFDVARCFFNVYSSFKESGTMPINLSEMLKMCRGKRSIRSSDQSSFPKKFALKTAAVGADFADMVTHNSAGLKHLQEIQIYTNKEGGHKRDKGVAGGGRQRRKNIN